MISAVVIARNEEKNIADCLDSLKWCNEIIVVDDNSSDRTVEIAKKMGANVFNNPLDADFSKQRNFCLSKAKNEWVLFIDADERPSLGLIGEINQIIHSPMIDANGFYIKRRDHLWGKTLRFGETGNAWFIRLARKQKGLFKGKVHEAWMIEGKTLNLNNPIEHYPHQKIADFLKEINFYSTLRAQELHAKGQTAGVFSIIVYPTAKFIKNYIINLGILDLIPGFICAVLMSMHSFLVRGKLWTLSKK